MGLFKWRELRATPDPRDGRATPGYSWCFRCGTSWDKVPVRTVYWSDGIGSFSICGPCWSETTSSERLVYHVWLWAQQHIDGGVGDTSGRLRQGGDVAELMQLVRAVMGARDSTDGLDDNQRPSRWFPEREAISGESDTTHRYHQFTGGM